MVRPYRNLAPDLDAWLPTAFTALQLARVFRFAYYCAILMLLLINWLWWAWIVLVSLVVVNISLYLLLNNLSAYWLKKARLQSMRAACTPQRATTDHESQAERQLALAFKDASTPIYHQQIVPNQFSSGYEYRTDFAFYDASCGLRIDIEVDGTFKQHEDDIQEKMSRRDDWFISQGWHVLRFHDRDCYHASAACVVAIEQYIEDAARKHRSILRQILGPDWQRL